MADFKVRCVDDSGCCFTKGKIYDVVDGVITCDNGEKSTKYRSKFSNVETMNEAFISKFELVTEDYIPGAMPKLEQIQEFDLVKLRNGCVCIVCNMGNCTSTFTLNDVKMNISAGEIPIHNMTNELVARSSVINEYDIIAYKHFNSHREALHYFVAEKEPSWDWIRQEPKKMTLKQIEDILGYQVKIVKED